MAAGEGQHRRCQHGREGERRVSGVGLSPLGAETLGPCRGPLSPSRRAAGAEANSHWGATPAGPPHRVRPSDSARHRAGHQPARCAPVPPAPRRMPAGPQGEPGACGEAHREGRRSAADCDRQRCLDTGHQRGLMPRLARRMTDRHVRRRMGRSRRVWRSLRRYLAGHGRRRRHPNKRQATRLPAGACLGFARRRGPWHGTAAAVPRVPARGRASTNRRHGRQRASRLEAWPRNVAGGRHSCGHSRRDAAVVAWAPWRRRRVRGGDWHRDHRHRPVRPRMPGGVGGGSESLPSTRFGVTQLPNSFAPRANAAATRADIAARTDHS